MSAWALDRALTLSESGDGSLSAALDASLRGFSGIHGGHLAALALRAMRLRVPDQRQTPLTLTATYVKPVLAGDIDVAPDVRRAGRTLTAVRAGVFQEGELRVDAGATFGVAGAGLQRQDRAMPTVPAPQDCALLETGPVPESAGLGILHRPALGGLPLAGSGVPHGAVWMRLTEDRPVDDLSAVVLADGAVPAVFLAIDTFTPMPTVELVVHFANPVPPSDGPWLLAHLSSVHAGAGWAIDDLDLWTPAGDLVLTSRQLRHFPQRSAPVVPVA